MLAELATVQQLVLKVARQLFLTRHPDRKRVPRGSVEAAQLHLATSEPNCFTAALERPGAWPGAAPEGLLLFADARDITINALSSVAAGDALPELFPSSALELLAALGRRLEGNEWLVVRDSAAAQSARVDQQSRARLAQMIRRPLKRVESIDGEVEQLDDANDRCILRTRAGDRIELPFDVTQRDSLVEALQLRPIARVRVRGQLVLGPLQKMKPTEELEVVDDERAPEVQKVWERIGSFSQITDGWLQGEGRAPTERATSVARGVLGRLLVEQRELPRPRVFPTPTGGVQAEWVLGRWAANVSFDPDDGRIEAEATHAETGEERSETFSRTQVSADTVAPLADWLESLI